MATETQVVVVPAERERKEAWDAFLDAYSKFLNDPTPLCHAEVHLKGEKLESCDASFSIDAFEKRIGLNLSVA